MTNTPTAAELAEAIAERAARLDFWTIEAAAVEAARFARVGELYRRLTADGPTVAALEPLAADQFTPAGWRYAAVLAEAEAEELPDAEAAPLVELAAEYRRRVLEASGQSRDLDPGSAGYLMTVYPRRVEEADGSVVVTCAIPLTKRGLPCTWAAARVAEAAHQAHEAYLAHVIHDHSTTAGAAGAEPGQEF